MIMSFRMNIFQSGFAGLNVLLISMVCANAAEWKAEPSIYLKTLYNDNVRMRTDEDNPEASTGVTVVPRIKLAAEEQYLWDMSLDTRGKITRFQDIEDADSENAFIDFDSGRKTELTEWRLNASFERNSTLDTDFDTKTPDLGLDDHTERTTASVSPSVRWDMSETSQISFGVSTTDVSYDEVTNLNFRDYDFNSVNFNAYWAVLEKHQLGFSSSYAEYESPEADFSYDQSVLQVNYTYTISETSNIRLSVGGRKLDSTITDATVACEANGVTVPVDDVSNTGVCPATIGNIFTGIFPVTPVLGDISNVENGSVFDLTYSSQTETLSHSLTAGRTVSPSSFGGAQEILSATYQLDIKNTERFSTNLILDASDSETVSGVSSLNDRERYRFEPSITHKLTRNWALNVSYSYIKQTLSNTDQDSTSNTLYVSLFLHWPKLATTY